jgi:hypothetical protein
MNVNNTKVFVGSIEQVINKVVRANVDRMLPYIKRTFTQDFPLKLTVSYSPKRNRSWGGSRRRIPFISLAIRKYASTVVSNGNYHFSEYDDFANHPVIGSVKGNWQKAIATLVAHELAHAVQHHCTMAQLQKAGIARYEKNHGDCFKAIYAMLRTEFVNGFDERLLYTLQTEVFPIKLANAMAPAPKKVKKTGVRMELSKSKNGWFIHKYFDAVSGELLGTMASKPRFISQGWVNGEWQTIFDPTTGTAFKNHTEAKKFFIGK